jgi:hypothetical protein
MLETVSTDIMFMITKIWLKGIKYVYFTVII